MSLAAAEALHDGREAARVLTNAGKQRRDRVRPVDDAAHGRTWRTRLRSQLERGDEIVVTVADHETNIGCWERLESSEGVVVKRWKPDSVTGELDLAELDRLMGPRTRLVCAHHVSNILGFVNPIADWAAFVHERGARICIDGVAYAPHRAVDVRAWDVDYYAFSLYKTYGPHHAILYGKRAHLLELDTLYHFFYGRDRVPGKLEPGNANYELSSATCGVVDYLASLAPDGAVDVGCGRRLGDRKRARAADRCVRCHHAPRGRARRPAARLARRATGLPRRRSCGQPRIVARADDRVPGRWPRLRRRGERDGAAPHRGAFRRLPFAPARRAPRTRRAGRRRGARPLVHYNTLEEVDRLTAALDEELGRPA